MNTGTAQGRKKTIIVNGRKITGRKHLYSGDILTTKNGRTFVRVIDEGKKWRPFEDLTPVKSETRKTIYMPSRVEGRKRARKIRKLWATGKYTKRELSEMFGYRSHCSVTRILNNELYPEIE